MSTTDLDRIEQHLTAARDALMAYWEQPEGQACMLSLRLATDALSDYRAIDGRALQASASEDRQRIAALADEVTRLYAPLEGTI